MKVAVLMGSPNDREKMQPAVDTLEKFGIEADVRVLSAHRNPRGSRRVRVGREGERLRGAHLWRGYGGASWPARQLRTPRCRWSAFRCRAARLNGVDALYSTVQMPPGIPVATVAVDGAMNAALLVVQMLSINDESLATQLEDLRAEGRS